MNFNISKQSRQQEDDQASWSGVPKPMKRILLVDNQAHVLRVLKSTLHRNGYEVDTALKSDVALGKIRADKYDVLIADSQLEKLSGQQLINTISEQFKARAPIMFLVTEEECDRFDEWSAELELIECLPKPISLHYLLGRLNELFPKYDEAA